MTTAFKVQMNRLRGLKFPPADLITHWEALHDMAEALLVAAVSRAQRECDEFPSPDRIKLFADQLRSQVIPLPEPEDRGVDLPDPLNATLPNGTVLPFTREWKYYCEACSDTGWKTWRCGPGTSTRAPWGVRSVCHRNKEHDAHEWVGRCVCAESNPAVKRKRESELQMATKRAEYRTRDR